MAALISKPGVTSASLMSIPKDWSSSWFGSIVNNLLQGADVRNAVGANGIVVSGNITSPYATISIGGAAGGVTFPDTPSGPNLVVGTLGPVSFYKSTNMPSSLPSGLVFETGFGSPTRGRIIIGDGTGWQLLFSSWTGGVATDLITFTDKGGSLIQFGTTGAYVSPAVNKGVLNYDQSGGTLVLAARSSGGTTRIDLRTSVSGTDTVGMRIDSSLGTTIQGLGPASNVLVDMSPDRGTFTPTAGAGQFSAGGNTGTCTWYRIGNLVALNISGFSGTSSSTALTITNLPAAIQPSLTQTVPAWDLQDNGVAGVVCAATFSGGTGTITFSYGKTTSSGASWTNVGTKGVVNTGGTTIFYLLN